MCRICDLLNSVVLVDLSDGALVNAAFNEALSCLVLSGGRCTVEAMVAASTLPMSVYTSLPLELARCVAKYGQAAPRMLDEAGLAVLLGDRVILSAKGRVVVSRKFSLDYKYEAAE